MLKIGDLSRLARISVKALRHYEAIGLLPPDHVGPNGYRYYSPAQIERLRHILTLKECGFGLGAIAKLMRPEADTDAVTTIFSEQRDRLKTQIEADRESLRRLEAFLAEPGLLQGGRPPVIMPIPDVLALTHRATISRDSNDLEEMFEKAEAAAAAQAARADGSPFLILHDPADGGRKIDVEVCIPVERAHGLSSVRIVEGSDQAVITTYRGAYENTAKLYAGMLRWAAAGRRRPAGPLREVYRRFGAHQRGYSLPGRVLAKNPSDYVTQLQVPLR